MADMLFPKKHYMAATVTQYNTDVVLIDTKLGCSASWTPAEVAQV
jgi:hypothetical protein